ncbi:hypothetical protein DIPPA_25629 [Diplonema papillatum]|nr:hypothetical protein DIPPA_25629 [Diplonema papillatum]
MSLTAPVALSLMFAVPALGYVVYMLTYMGVWVVFHRLDPTSIRALFPRTIDDSHPSEPPTDAADFWVRVGGVALANAGLFAAVFAAPHVLMASRLWKQFVKVVLRDDKFTRLIYNVTSAAALHVILEQWTPLRFVVWDLTGSPSLCAAMHMLAAAGVALQLFNGGNIDMLEFMGVRQLLPPVKPKPARPMHLSTTGLYGFVRHPLMTGFFLLVWATPHMTLGHLLFAAEATAFIVGAVVYHEEPLLEADFPPGVYAEYCREVPCRFVPFVF